MDQRLKNVAEEGNIDALYALFRENPYILENIDQIPFVDTPLHIAASAGCTHFAAEMIRLKPSFGRKLNPDGLSPLHLALQNGHTETVIRLINIDNDLIRVQGKESITPLHYVAERNESELLAEFLCACPASIKDLTVRGETGVHIATRNGSFEAVKVLLGWLRKFDNEGLESWKMLNWKDENGNTALHIAACANQRQVAKLLIKNKVDKMVRNLEGRTAFDLSEGNEEFRTRLFWGCAITSLIYQKEMKSSTSLAHFMSAVKLHEKLLYLVPNMHNGLSSDMKNMLLVVAVLIATATYQIVLQPPGGFRQEDNNLNSTAFIINSTSIDYIPINNTTINSTAFNRAGTIVMPADNFNSINFFNSAAFAAAVGVIYLSLPMTYHSVLLGNSLIYLAISYMTSMSEIATSPNSVWISFGAYLFFSILVWLRIWILRGERKIFTRVTLCRFNPTHYVKMRHQLVGW
ncbi:ankyrin repeat-containing protein BDA1-like [Cornus florida]|uniref:ankyrin repeat-containing protein BDA1-like n=1 Tax=Cornus florida TaxID=4283 RepID=UPI00289EEFE8|nr:ankyrin repeat-containing protein BDA1-like [Cornus florida]